MVDPRKGVGGLYIAKTVQMAHNPKPTEPRQPNQSTHSGFYGYNSGKKSIRGDDVWHIIPNSSVVQIENRAVRFYANFPYKLVVS